MQPDPRLIDNLRLLEVSLCELRIKSSEEFRIVLRLRRSLICYECEIFCWYETIRSSPGGPLDPSGQHGLTVRPLLSSDWSGGRPYWPVIGCAGVWRRAGTVLVSSSDVGEELG